MTLAPNTKDRPAVRHPASDDARGRLPGLGSMPPPLPDPIPANELQTGRRDTLDRLMPEVYDELRAVARRQLSGREGGGTLSTTRAKLLTKLSNASMW